MTRTNLFSIGLRTLALTAVCAGLVSNVNAADHQPGTTPPAASQIAGIALHDGGGLYGRVLDTQGRPLAKQKVRILSRGQLVVATETNAQGQFGLRSLRGGLHTIETAGGRQKVQLWAPHTAPPSADRVVEVVEGQDRVVRGQSDEEQRRRHRLSLIALGLGVGGLGWALDHNPAGS